LDPEAFNSGDTENAPLEKLKSALREVIVTDIDASPNPNPNPNPNPSPNPIPDPNPKPKPNPKPNPNPDPNPNPNPNREVDLSISGLESELLNLKKDRDHVTDTPTPPPIPPTMPPTTPIPPTGRQERKDSKKTETRLIQGVLQAANQGDYRKEIAAIDSDFVRYQEGQAVTRREKMEIIKVKIGSLTLTLTLTLTLIKLKIDSLKSRYLCC